MWEAVVAGVVIILHAGSAASDYLDQEPQLKTPFNLSIAHLNHTAVEVWWNFTTPDDRDTEAVKFTFEVKKKGLLDKFYYPRFERTPYHQIVAGLEPGTTYTLEIFARAFGYEKSKTLKRRFTTNKRDWATPVIDETSQKDVRVGINFTVIWSCRGRRDRLDHLRIEFCPSRNHLDRHMCTIFRRTPDHRRVTILVEYYMIFWFRIIAVHHVPVLGVVERGTEFITEYTRMGKPGDVKGPTMIQQIGPDLAISWQEIADRNGPLQSYDIIISDVQNKSLNLHKWTDGNTAVLINANRTFMIGETYDVRIRGSSHSQGSAIKGDFAIFRFTYLVPSTPTVADVLYRSQDRIRFQVKHAGSRENRIFQIRTEARYKLLDRQNGLMELIGLSPYEKVEIRIRDCAKSETTDTWLCGDYGTFKFTSHVAVPSRIPFVHIESVGYSDCILAVWRKPESPQGPLDGYRITLSPTHTMKVLEETYFISFGEKIVLCDTNLDKFSHTIGISAFNFDSLNGSVRLVANPVYRLLFPVRRSRQSFIHFVLRTTCVVSLLGSILTFSVFLTLRGEETGDRTTRQDPVTPPPDDEGVNELNE